MAKGEMQLFMVTPQLVWNRWGALKLRPAKATGNVAVRINGKLHSRNLSFNQLQCRGGAAQIADNSRRMLK